MKNFKIDSSIDTTIRQSILGIIKDHWDSFCKQGASRTMFNLEFFLDTGDSSLVCCRHPVYCLHEKKIMNTHIKVFENVDWICDCVGPWSFLLLLATKPHQEGCKDIKEFIWYLYVSYCPLHSVTCRFEYSNPRCTDSI